MDVSGPRSKTKLAFQHEYHALYRQWLDISIDNFAQNVICHDTYMPYPYILLKMLDVGGQSVDTWLDHHSPNRILSTLFLPETSRLSSLSQISSYSPVSFGCNTDLKMCFSATLPDLWDFFLSRLTASFAKKTACVSPRYVSRTVRQCAALTSGLLS